MKVKSMDLSWVVVHDLKKAIKFYTEIVGLKLVETSEEFGWAELQGHEGGSRLGLAQMQPESEIKPGENACVTLTVDNLGQAIESVRGHGVHCLGDIIEVPGHVKMQMISDQDGNLFQLVEML